MSTHPFDSLTGLPGRGQLLDRIDESLAAGPAVLMVSLDNFRAVNDSLGHDVGDVVLRDIAVRLRELAGPADFVARLGSDEFALVVGAGTREEALTVARRVGDGVRRPVRSTEQDLWLSASIGVCLAAPDGTARTMLRDADTAMHAAKARGAGLLEVFEPEMRAAVQNRLGTTTDLGHALATGTQLFLHFQPVVDLRTGSTVGAEALVRWRHPERGMVRPDEFIGIAEETGLIADLGRWVLETSVAQLAAWQPLVEGREFRLHVNLSPVEFRHPGLVEGVVAVIERYGVDPSNVLLEITETGLMTNGAEAMNLLHGLQKAGVGLGIDDFGTGYSSIAYLGQLPVDTVKLDRSLIAGIGSSPYEYGLARAIFELMSSAGLRVVAEGIETATQVAHLRALDCRLGQGFHLARPAEADVLTATLTAEGSA